MFKKQGKCIQDGFLAVRSRVPKLHFFGGVDYIHRTYGSGSMGLVCLPKIYHKYQPNYVGKYTIPMDPSWAFPIAMYGSIYLHLDEIYGKCR